MINRRESLGLLTGVLMTATASSGEAATHNDSDAGGSSGAAPDLLQSLMKLRAALDDRMTLEWFQGVVYGVVDSAMTPLFSVNAVAFAWYQQAEDGSFRGRRAEVTYHGDLASGKRLSTFVNPYNDKILEVPMSRTPSQDAVIDNNGLVIPGQMGPLRIEGFPSLGPITVNGARSWVRMDTRSRLFAPGVEKPVTEYGESISYAGRTADLLDQTRMSAPCQISYTNVMSWRPWMQMDGRSGHTVTVASGEKVESLAEVPPQLGAFVRAEHPDLAEDARVAIAAATQPGG